MAFDIVIVGFGRVGSVLARALHQAGHRIVDIVDRDPDKLDRARNWFPKAHVSFECANWKRFDMVLLAVNDDAIKQLAQRLCNSSINFSGTVVAHTSGLHPSEEIACLRQKGAFVGSLHPVQSFSGSEEDVGRLSTSYFVLEGDTRALPVLRKLVESLDSRFVILEAADKPAHHLACVFASNFLVALLNAASQLYSGTQIDPEKAKALLLPLVRNTVEHLSVQSLEQALTGPIARGDIGTVRSHIRYLESTREPLLTVYQALGNQALALAKRNPTLPDEKIKAMERLLSTLKSDLSKE